MANQFDQFDAQAAPSGNPFDQFDPGAKAAPAQSKYAGGGLIGDAALAFLNSVDFGLAEHNPLSDMPEQVKQDVALAHQNLGWMDYPVSAAGYAVGPGKFLGPAGATAGLVGRPIAQAAAEGALAGGISNTIKGGDPLTGAIAGGAIGGAAGGVGKGIAKLTAPAAPTIDPAAEVARTQAARTNAYSALNAVPMNPAQVDRAIGGVMGNLDPSVETGMSPGLNRQINDIRDAVQQQGQVNAGQVDSWIRQINDAAQRERYPTDRIVAGQIDDQLSGLINANGAGDLRAAASAAHARYADAQQLQQLQQQLSDFNQGPGNIPQQQIRAGGYQPGDPRYEAWAAIAKAGQKGMDPSYTVGHLGGEAAEVAALATLGPWAMLPAKALGYLGAKQLAKKATGGLQGKALLKAYQSQYPPLTGATPPPAQAANPMIGDLIKNLVIGGAY